ncbi:MAG: ABC1 kinase family protein [Maricaulaceae bacterium]
MADPQSSASSTDRERDRLTGRAARVAKVGAGLSGAAVAAGANRLFGKDEGSAKTAQALKAALGGIKGPLMKAAQMIATIPDALPPEFAEELAQLQTNAPPMGRPFVRRRMKAELGPDWRARFDHFDEEACAAASLGQVHKARHPDGRALASKLQYPDMASAVEADLAQLKVLFNIFKRMDGSIDPTRMGEEIGERLREELDYAREAKHMALYKAMLAELDAIRTPQPVPELSSQRLLSMTWLEGRKIIDFVDHDLDTRNTIATNLFQAWWRPMGRYGVIHGDPHLGNYTVAKDGRALNLLDFGCVRIFPAQFVDGVVSLYRALMAEDRDAQVAAYELWGFHGLSNDLIDTLNLWARFIYGPLMDDRVRPIADGISPGQYGRKEAFTVRQRLKEHGPVTIPAEFVFMDRAAIGLGAAFLHLGAELNFRALFEAEIDGFERQRLADRQAEAMTAVGLAPQRDVDANADAA